jgi:hypothetical protein
MTDFVIMLHRANRLQNQVDEALKAVQKPNEELKTDDVLSWLQSKYPIG